MTRILVVQNFYPPHHYGGYELSCRDVVEEWRRRGHHVDVLSGDHRVSGTSDLPNEEGVQRDLPSAFKDGDLWSPPRRTRLARERRAQRVLQDALATTKPDVVSIWHLAALPTSLLVPLVASGIPLAFVVCDDWLLYAPKIDPWMSYFVDRPRLGRAVERVTGVPAHVPDIASIGTFCFVSDLVRRRACEFGGFHFPVSTVTYSGIDHRDFPPLPAPAASGDRPWRWRLLQADRFDPRKGIETSVRAFARLPVGAQLQLLGRGDDKYKAHIEQLAAELGVADRLTAGAVPRREMAAHYGDADVLLFPVEWDEPFGLTPVEAMACGTPVIATGRGGSGEFLADGVNCLLFPEGDDAGLAAAVTRLAGDVDLRRQLVAGGLRTATELGVDRLAEVLEAWHVGAAQGFPQGTPGEREGLAFGRP
jgi:glycosyltransferase involved in cell wall biosynthesis